MFFNMLLTAIMLVLFGLLIGNLSVYAPFKEFLPVIYVILGFLLGLLGTVFTEYLQKRRRREEFRNGTLADLKQALAVLHGYAYLLDSKMDREKLRFLLQCITEFDLFKETRPLVEDTTLMDLTKRHRSDEDLDACASTRNSQVSRKIHSDIFFTIRKVHCLFIEGNLSGIAFLELPERAFLLNILRKIRIINEQISRLDFTFEKSYDSTLSDTNRERLKINYEGGRQFLADLSYETTREIVTFLRKHKG